MNNHVIPVAPKEVVQESHREDVEIKSSQEKDEPLSNRYDTIIAQHTREVNADYFDLVPSRGFLVRNLSLQQKNESPLVMLVSKYEGEFSMEEKACLAQIQGVLVLERFLSLVTGKVFQNATYIFNT